jgi:hypothetical protein
MTKYKFTMRKIGYKMTTVMVPLHIAESDVEWVAQQLLCSKNKAVQLIRNCYEYVASNALDWQTLCINPKTNKLETISIDDAKSYLEDGWKVVINK